MNNSSKNGHFTGLHGTVAVATKPARKRKTTNRFDNHNGTAMEVLVYKTNINHTQDVEQVRPYLSEHTDILKWHVDIEDEDRVLRVEALSDISGKIEHLVRNAGYTCDELE